MRKLLLLVILTVGFTTIYAQGTPAPAPPPSEKKNDINKAGIKLGINSSVLTGQIADTTQIGSRTGFSGGIFYREGLGGIFGGQIEIRYIQMGGVNNVLDIETQLDYVRFGVQFKLYPLTSTLGANAFFGAEYGILINAKQQDPVDKNSYIDVADFYSGSDFGIHAGVGLDFDFGFTTDLRAYFGLADVTEGTPDAHNFSLQFNFGWGF